MTELFTLFFAGSFFFSGDPDMPPVEGDFFPPPQKITREVEITAESAIVVEVETGMPLWEKNAHKRRAMASLTKMATALLVLEQGNLDVAVAISRDAPVVDGSKMGLLAGEEMTRNNLLAGLLIKSANDAAIALSLDLAKSEAEFVQKMNRRVHFLGLVDTHFENPHGLDAPNHFSTAFDLALLARTLLRFDEVRTLANTKTKTVSSVDEKFSHLLMNTNELLWSDFPIFGLKTGTTDEAGQCLVALVRSHQREFLIVVLGSTNRFQDVKALLWAIENREK